MNTNTVQKARTRFAELYAGGGFRPVDRYISDRSTAEDRLADAVAQTYEMDARYAAKGKVLDEAILVHSCRLRAVDPARRFVKTDAQPARDVLHQPNFTSGKLQVHRLEGLLNADTGGFDGEGDRALELALHHHMTEDPTMKIIGAIDLAEWLETLDRRDVNLLVLRQSGFTLEEIAEATGGSTTMVFSRLKTLGMELAERAGLSITKKPRRRGKSAVETESASYDV